jgi:flagellar FliJ protein
MSVNLKSLQIVIDLAMRRRDEAAGRLAQAQANLIAAQTQLKQLQDYVHDGEVKWRERASAGVSTSLFNHQQQFVRKIQHALDFQTTTIAQRESTLAQCQAALQSTERELATLQKVAERTRIQIATARSKAEQKHNDEMAMTMMAHQRRTAAQEAHS